jgi:pyruvate,orthophosphate dikinase
MQLVAIFDSIYQVSKNTNQTPSVNIIVPIVSILSEFEFVSSAVRRTITQKKQKYGFDFDIRLGCMLETPRACLLADTFVYYCDFVCFGTNDLTQLTFGFSRDDCVQFLNEYYKESLMYSDPFTSLDATGVAELVAIAVDRVRKVKRDIPVWLFGEQITDAVAIDLALQLGINKLSISPSKIPAVVLAQAQSILRNKQK